MSVGTKPWTDGNGVITLSPDTGEGDGSVAVSSEDNDGLDREQVLTVTAGSTVVRTVKVVQPGLRELFCGSDMQFGASYDDEFAVIKTV